MTILFRAGIGRSDSTYKELKPDVGEAGRAEGCGGSDSTYKELKHQFVFHPITFSATSSDSTYKELKPFLVHMLSNRNNVLIVPIRN